MWVTEESDLTATASRYDLNTCFNVITDVRESSFTVVKNILKKRNWNIFRFYLWLADLHPAITYAIREGNQNCEYSWMRFKPSLFSSLRAGFGLACHLASLFTMLDCSLVPPSPNGLIQWGSKSVELATAIELTMERSSCLQLGKMHHKLKNLKLVVIQVSPHSQNDACNLFIKLMKRITVNVSE